MRLALLIFFLFLFLPTASFADTYPYNGKTPLMPSQSKTSGDDHEWLRLCAGTASKNAQATEKQVKKLSTPDYKVYRKAKAAERAKNYSGSTGCKDNVGWVIKRNNNYIKALKSKVDVKLGITTPTVQKKRYCKRLNETVYHTFSISNKPCAQAKEISKTEYENIRSGKTTTKASSTSNNIDSMYLKEFAVKYCGKYSAVNFKGGIKCSNKIRSTKTTKDKIYCLDAKANRVFYYMKSNKVGSCFSDQLEISKTEYENIRSGKTTTKASSTSNNIDSMYLKEFAVKYCGKYSAVNFKGGIKCSNKIRSTKTTKDKIYCLDAKANRVFYYMKSNKVGSCFSDQLEISKTEYENIRSGKTTQVNKELKEAQNYINDLLVYIKTYPSTFDIITISEFMVTNMNVLNGSWSNLEREEFKLFKNYTKTSTDFMKFHNSQNDIRGQEALTRLTAAENELKRHINYFTFYLQNNVTSNLAPGVLDNIKLAEKTLATKNLEQFNIANKKFNTYITNNNLTADYRKFIEFVSAVNKETKVKTKTKKANTTLISSKKDFIKAQTYLKKLGFYDGDAEIDGLFGSKSKKALNQWQEDNNLAITSSITVDLLATLEKHASASKKEISKKVIIVDSKTTEQTMYDKERLSAQNYILDLFKFIAINPDTFDIIQITELISVNKDILDGKWNEVQQKDFALLKEFAATSADFIKFHSRQNDQRQKDILNKIALQNSKLKNIISYFKYYLKNNITSDIATSVIKNVKFAETSLEDQNLGTLIAASRELEAFISKNNFTTDYRKFVDSMTIKTSEAVKKLEEEKKQNELVEQERLTEEKQKQFEEKKQFNKKPQGRFIKKN